LNEYIYSQPVHKDFHGIISYLIKFIRKNYGESEVESFFKEASAYIYKPLIERVKKNGLVEIKKHLERIFSMENGDFDLDYNENKLVFNVRKCPAIWHMKDKKFEIDREFCKFSTEIVSAAIARECGYNFKVEYDQEKGKCTQKFWKDGK
jgi:hypothetical protein